MKFLQLILLSLLAFCLAACQPSDNNSEQEASLSGQSDYKQPLVIKHQLGEMQLNSKPDKVAALDMNEVDFLDSLGIPIAGMVTDFIPHFLSHYQNDSNISDLGAIVQPNVEKIYTLKPDLILITPLHSMHYDELSRIAPTLHYDVDYKSGQNHIATINEHLLQLGTIFNKEEEATTLVNKLNDKISEIRKITSSDPAKALIVLHNNGSYSHFGTLSRYGFVFTELGVKPAFEESSEASLHGQPISSEFISKNNPDIIFIIDRTAVMQHQPVIRSEQINNTLIKQTKAWQNNKIIFADADAWYTTAASPTSLSIILDQVLEAYE